MGKRLQAVDDKRCASLTHGISTKVAGDRFGEA
jgi:hypothetical protein